LLTLVRAICILVFFLSCGVARSSDNPPGTRAMAAAQQILADAKVAAANGCSETADVLVQVLCKGTIRVGLRTYYPGFSVRDERGEFKGFEVDVAKSIADFLGVRLMPVAVNPQNRIPMVADGDIDLVIATMSHLAQRDREVTFIRPHYYESETVVVGAKAAPVANWRDLAGQTACLPVGSGSNILFTRHRIPVLTFDKPEELLDALEFNECPIIVHDDTFFGTLLTDPEWSAKYAIKFGFAPTPWGMAVAREHSEKFAALLSDLSVAWHADGEFLRLAQANRLDTTFLSNEHERWSASGCVFADGSPKPECLAPPVRMADVTDTSAFAERAETNNGSLIARVGAAIGLPFLRESDASRLLLQGIGYSLALIVGAQIATALFALAFSRLMGGASVLRGAVAAVTAIGQTTPLPLLMFFGYIIAGGVTQYTGVVALIAAVIVLGFYNGCNAGRAIHEARQAMQAASTSATSQSYWRVLSLASIQLIAFLINAAKGSPAAGMIGVPEFLNVMTDLTSYSHDRMTVYLILLLFYTGLVLLVITLLYAVRTRLTARVERMA
jgi:polar amino acid transport system substrate-binding protein